MKDCVFCEKFKEDSISIIKDMGVIHFEPLNPVVPGHRLFVAVEHFAYPHMNPGITGLVFNMASKYARRFPEDYNLIVNGGPDAGQTVNHMHVHYVPRRKDDGLLLPWSTTN